MAQDSHDERVAPGAQTILHPSCTTRPVGDLDISDIVASADAEFGVRRLEKAVELYQIVLRNCPDHSHALHRLALAAVHGNRFDEAQTYIESALRVAPDNAELWEHAGLIAASRGAYGRAEICYQRAIRIAGGTVTLHRNLGDCLLLSGRSLEAREQYLRVIALEPQLHHANRALAQICEQFGDNVGSANYWDHAWKLNPADPLDGISLITALAKVGRSKRLEEVVDEMKRRFADNVPALERLAFVLYKHYLHTEALDVIRHGLIVAPRSAPLHHYAALTLGVCGRAEESLSHSMEAVRLWPENLEMQYHLAGLELARGEFKEGWKRHKAIYALPNPELVIPLGIQEWNGEPLEGCEILLVGEQGDGDKIQCIRFAEWLSAQGARIDLLVTGRLAGIFASMKCIRAVYSSTAPAGQYDYWTYLMKIPEYMGLEVSMLPAVTIPYLFPTPEKVHHWRSRLDSMSTPPGNVKGLRIGVAWAGRARYIWDRFRSIQLDLFKPLFSSPETSWYSVQKGPRETESEALANEFDIHTLGPLIDDFMDTLAILETLDLLITVDTSVAHLAGAAGRPVWVLVPAYAQWRWLGDRTDTPWYPSMRVFRQRELDHWEPVIEEVRQALLEIRYEGNS
ncbi:tetratricopeptide repeat protein [Paraburkholderia sp. DHOC27]|uniref:tetratricopeptide repeat protein n=1 Tax=Paraburkholderia sp. DHOC27 TaxID=2303330 RepID=UPI000E3B9E00|nr:tetratricopeptide repeat protein [Paraburkholderia sp. DHOC27]RFU48357.1 hypothetical protein D0B32_00465 [Paraburkholderia sp. DHOC27]